MNMRKTFQTPLYFLAILSIAFTSPGALDLKAKEQISNNSTTECAGAFEIVRGVYLQIFNQPPDNLKVLADAAEKLDKKETTVKTIVRELVMSTEYSSRFVIPHPAEEAAKLLYLKTLARSASPEEVRSASERIRREGFAATVNEILNGSEYQEAFGEYGVPTRPVRFTACRFPMTLVQKEILGANQEVSTTLTIHDGGVMEAITNSAVRDNSPMAANRFCTRLAFWLYDKSGNLIEVIGPAQEEPKCVGGKTPESRERKDEWQGAVSPQTLGRLAAVAILHTNERSDPISFTRDNMEKAKQVRKQLP
jgi:hypothetical protein